MVNNKENEDQPQPLLTHKEWEDLIDGAKEMFEKHTMGPKRYMILYSYVFKYCSAVGQRGLANATAARVQRQLARSGTRQTRNQARQQPRGPDDLFTAIRSFLTKHVNRIMGELLASKQTGTALLAAYSAKWHDYDFSATALNGVCAYYNQHNTHEEVQPGGEQRAGGIQQLGKSIWLETVFNLLHGNLTEAILQLIEESRVNGSFMLMAPVLDALQSYVRLGEKLQPVGEEDYEDPDDKLAIYRQHFEEQFLKSTKAYYHQAVGDYLADGNMIAYVRKVEEKLDEEKTLCQRYLHISTLGPLNETLHRAMIVDQMPSLQQHFESAFERGDAEELRHLYDLFSRVTYTNIIQEPLEFAEAHIKKEGRQAIEAVAVNASDNHDVYITTILRVHAHYKTLLTAAFADDARFVRAMDIAHSAFINSNLVTEQASKKSKEKSSEMLSRYVDALLRGSGKTPGTHTDLEKSLDDVITVFAYIVDKDIFEKEYLRRLAIRIVNGTAMNNEAEEAMLTRLQRVCGTDYTEKMRRLFTDRELSKRLMESYKTRGGIQHEAAGADFNAIVLGANAWPFDREMEEVPLPAQFEQMLQQFTTFYKSQHSARKLDPLVMRSRGEIVCGELQRKYRFVIAILLHFNTTEVASLAEVIAASRLDKALTIKQLQPMLRERLLLVVNNADAKELPADVSDDVQLKFNRAFSHKKMKVDLSRFAKAKDEGGKGKDSELSKEVEMDRKTVIQAAIVRVMKMRKKQKHAQLIGEVIRQVNRFGPSVPLIKKCVEELIEKEYIKRAADDNDSYEYMA